MKTTRSFLTMRPPLQGIGETLKARYDRCPGPSHPVHKTNLIFHSIFPQTADATKRIASMAVRCLRMIAITEVLSEHLEIDNEIWLYCTCTAVYQGNKAHRDILKELRAAFYSPHSPPTLQRLNEPSSIHRNRGQNGEVVERAPPWY